MNIIAIIQARMNSTRLPGKVLLDLEGKTVLERVIERVKASKLVDKVVVATTINDEDLKIVELCAKLGVNVYCGSEEDVLDRYYQAARLFKAQNIVRITADCPLIDTNIIDQVIDLHLQEDSDYTSNTIKETYPDGLDVDVIKYKALEKAWKEAKLASEREHVDPYILNHPEIFKLTNKEYKEDYSQKRWTLDNQEDYEFIKIIYMNLHINGRHFGMHNIIEYLTEQPEIEDLNKHIVRNEGYARSLREDKVLNE